MSKDGSVTHVAGTFLIQADGAFLNGAGLGQGEDRNVTIPKTFRDGRGGEVPYVSAQAWKRWLRTTAVEEAGWTPSEPQAIGWNPKGNVNKIAGQLNPVEYPEDDIFGYMRAAEGQGRTTASPDEDDDSDDEAQEQTRKTKSVMRASPFAASLLMSIRSRDWRGQDEGFVHLTKFNPDTLAEAEVGRFLSATKKGSDDKAGAKDKKDPWKELERFDPKLAKEARTSADAHDLDGLRRMLTERAARANKEVTFIENATSPLPYTTRFYNTHLQGIFCVDYSRLGVFWNLGDRVELEESKVKQFLKSEKIKDVTTEEPFKSLSVNGALGRIYALRDNNERKSRASALLNALARLRGGAKQAQFGTDVAPKVLIIAGLNCGNPIFNHLFRDTDAGPEAKIDTIKEILADFADRIVTPVVIGIRAGYLKNEADLREIKGWHQATRKDGTISLDGPHQGRGAGQGWVEIRITTPVEASKMIGELLP